MNSFFTARKNIFLLTLCFLLLLVLMVLTFFGGYIDIDKAVLNLSNRDGAKKCVPAQWLDPANGDNGFFGFYCSYSLCTSFRVIKTVKVNCRETDGMPFRNARFSSENEYPYWGKLRR